MKLKIPLTGTVLVEGSVFGEGELSGNPNDPIRPIDIDLGNVSWVMVGVDLDNEEIEIEVTPWEKISKPTGEVDKDGEPIYMTRETTDIERASSLQYAKDLIVTHTKDELYTLTKCSTLKRPFIEKK